MSIEVVKVNEIGWDSFQAMLEEEWERFQRRTKDDCGDDLKRLEDEG